MNNIDLFVYQTEQIREIETLAASRIGPTDKPLMRRAAKSAYMVMQRYWPMAKSIYIYAGGGNNGGDGYTMAAIARHHGLQPVVWQVGDHSGLSGDAKEAYEFCLKDGIDIRQFDDRPLEKEPDLIVDAICGIGLDSELRGEPLKAVKFMQTLAAPCLAVDIPTGINADTGQVMGLARKADVTVTFIGLKLGLLTGEGASYTGKLHLEDLATPSELYQQVCCIAEKAELKDYSQYLVPRSKNWHKGLSGHVLVIGGDMGFAGAPLMAARAALQVGAGLVTVATHPEHAAAMDASCAEVMCHGVADANELAALIHKADVLVLGPGLGQSAWSLTMWSEAMMHKQPMIVDADGLNILASNKMTHDQWILTPHPGEAARLLGETVSEVQADRLTAVKTLSEQFHGVCVLKGAGSLIAGEEKTPVLCDKGNPGMATAGMGDILSGVIAGLLAQKIPLLAAARLGVILHASAGDLAAEQGERGLMATDLLPVLRKLSNPS